MENLIYLKKGKIRWRSESLGSWYFLLNANVDDLVLQLDELVVVGWIEWKIRFVIVCKILICQQHHAFHGFWFLGFDLSEDQHIIEFLNLQF